MAFLGQNFSANSVAPSTPMDLLPPGEYVVQIIASEMRPTKAADGSEYLWMEMDIIQGEYTNRKLWTRLNLKNHNAATVESAYRDLSAICHATGQLEISNTEMLHYKPMVVVVKVKPPKNGYEASNEIKGYKSMAGGAPAQQSQPRPAAAPQQSSFQPPPTVATPAGGAPWRRQ